MQHVCIHDDADTLVEAIVHCPGLEAHSYSSTNFDQVFFLRARLGKQAFDYDRALTEHRSFTQALEREGVSLISTEQLLTEALETSETAKNEFIERFLVTCGSKGDELLTAVEGVLRQQATGGDLASTAIKGITCCEAHLPNDKSEPLAGALGTAFDPDARLAGPMNTMYFTRDPATVIGGGIALCNMYWHDRARESLLYRTIFEHHPRFIGTPIWYQETSSYHIEGGNILNIGDGVVAVGISERTEPAAVDHLAAKLLCNPNQSGTKEVIAIPLPAPDGHRLHLDAFMTKVDHETFLIDPALLDVIDTYRLHLGPNCSISMRHEDGVGNALRHVHGGPMSFITCGGNTPSAAEHEAARNAPSVLCLAPGRVLACEGNPLTNDALCKAGIEVVPISLDELTYGFGGPCSLCLPLRRMA